VDLVAAADLRHARARVIGDLFDKVDVDVSEGGVLVGFESPLRLEVEERVEARGRSPTVGRGRRANVEERCGLSRGA